MSFAKKRLACIDVGSDAIKFASGVWSEGQVTLQQMAYLPYSAGAFQSQGLNAQMEPLKKLLEEQKIKDKTMLCVSDPGVPWQSFSVPAMAQKELSEAIRWELTQKKPFDIEKSVYDYIAVSTTFGGPSDANSKTVFIPVKSKDEIKRWTDFLNSKKIQLQAFETPNLALVNGLRAFGFFPSNDAAYIVLNLGALFTHILIVHQGHLVFERRIATAGDTLTKAIMEYCKVDAENAVKLKQEYGITSETMSDKIIEARHIQTSSLEKLVADIQYSLKYFSFQVTKSKITRYEKVYLSGGTARLPGLKDFMGERLQIPCETVDYSQKVTLPKDSPLSKLPLIWPLFATTIGLGFWQTEQLHEHCISFNANSDEKKSSGMTKDGTAKIPALILAGALLIFLCLSAFIQLKRMDQSLLRLNQQKMRADTEALRLQTDSEEAEQSAQTLEEDKKTWSAKVAEQHEAIVQSNMKHASSHEPLTQIAALRPQDLYLNKIQVQQDSVKLEGFAAGNELVSEFMKALNSAACFRNCHFLRIEKKTQDKVSLIEFELSLDKA